MADLEQTYGAQEVFGTLAGWQSSGGNQEHSSERSTAASIMGDEVASQLHSGSTASQDSLTCNNNTNTIPEEIGAVINGIVLESIEITTGDHFATMALSGHNHDHNAHASGPGAPRSFAHGQAVSKAWGPIDFLAGTKGDAELISGTIRIEVDHTDEFPNGEHACGENYKPRITATSEWLGTPEVLADDGWDVTSKTTVDEATGFVKTTVTGTKPITVT